MENIPPGWAHQQAEVYKERSAFSRFSNRRQRFRPIGESETENQNDEKPVLDSESTGVQSVETVRDSDVSQDNGKGQEDIPDTSEEYGAISEATDDEFDDTSEDGY